MSDGERRVAIGVHGIVQGVGFRPTVYKLARGRELQGWIRNESSGVEMEVAGDAEQVAAFLRDLSEKAPPLARIVDIEVWERPFAAMEPFHIVKSRGNETRLTLISPDVCTCWDCFREMGDELDRRYRYPFINCTNCGPRYTIIRDVPYDREKTTMAPFEMCAACRLEYENPEHRRFHAQPNACWACGPQVWLESAAGERMSERDAAVRQTVSLLEQSFIVAIKGLGGFHLAVPATDGVAVARLRSRKIREEKPFAVMFSDVAEVEKHCRVSERERSLLESQERPIVLLRRHAAPPSGAPIAEAVAPGNRFLGAFLPYTPLHRLLLNEDESSGCRALVMTSGNQSDEPIITENSSARARLHDIADYFLFHNRDIHLRCDDSVVRVVRDRPRPIRRARGYVPSPIFLQKSQTSVLAVGAELKNTICLTRGREAFLSQHIGDLENLETLKAFERNVEHLQRILDIRPELLVHDMHPDYLNTQWAQRQTQIQRLAVQHHHAHIASVLAEQKVDRPVLGLALDGTGYGTDGTIWGGELLLVDPKSHEFERMAHFRQLLMPGGQAAIREPWRMAVSALYALCPDDLETVYTDILARWPERDRKVLLQILRNRINCPVTSSCGRVFDAVSSLIGIRDRVSYEGQAAIELEQAIESDDEPYRGTIRNERSKWVIDPLPMLQQAVGDLRRSVNKGLIAARFHNGLIELLVELLITVAESTGIRRAALSGGVFQNAYLSERLETRLMKEGLVVFVHEQVPANDACIALGQAFVGGRFLEGWKAGNL